MKTKTGLLFVAIAFACGLAAAARAEVTVSDAWVRETIGGGKVSAAYARITNTGPQGDRLLTVAIEGGMAELHQSSDDHGMMKMTPVKALDIPAKGEALLAPGGYHLMLMNLPRQLKPGGVLPLTFVFEHAGSMTVQAKVAALSATKAP